jgi:hypothetical protein
MWLYLTCMGVVQGCTTQVPWRAENIFLSAKIICFTHTSNVLKKTKQTKFEVLRARLKAFAGRICSAGRML